MFIDAFTKSSDSPATSDILVKAVLSAQNISNALASRLLFYYATSLVPTEVHEQLCHC